MKVMPIPLSSATMLNGFSRLAPSAHGDKVHLLPY